MEISTNNSKWKEFSQSHPSPRYSNTSLLKTIHLRCLETKEFIVAEYEDRNKIIYFRNFDSLSSFVGLWLLPASMFALRAMLPEASIYADLPAIDEDKDLENVFQRAGFIINNLNAVFPVPGKPSDAIGEANPYVVDALIKLQKTEKFCGRSVLQEQYQSYVWRHCHDESMFWGMIRIEADIAKYFDVDRIFKQKIKVPFSILQKDADLHYILLNKALDICDENMNSFPFHEVSQRHRLVYAMAAYELAKIYLLDGKPLKALNILDDGILKGIQFDDKNLSKFANAIAKHLLPPPPAINFYSAADPSFNVPAKLQWSAGVRTEIRPSLDAFYKHCIVDSKPMVIKGVTKDFPIYEFFDFDYLNNTHGYRKVPIELGSSYTNDDYSQEINSIHNYLSKYVFSDTPSTAYLAQHALLDQFDLIDAVPVPDYAAMLPDSDENIVDPTMNVFIGPSGTLSPLHCDPRPNFFCQIRGKKFVRLVDWKYADRIPVEKNSINSNSSIADFENPDYDEFPQLVGLETEDIVLEAGDCLFIPQKYFHLMRSLSRSISISIWC